MEILIPGLILVALMVYASTKIKKSAAAAYAEEKIDAPDFSITKPEGFISPVENSGFAFAAYSKDFGTDEASEVRQVSADVKIFDNESLDGVRSAISNQASKVGTEQRLAGGGFVVETEEIVNGIVVECEHRVYERDGMIYALALKVLPEFKADQQKNIDTLIASFDVK